jgi:hypothetical protein
VASRGIAGLVYAGCGWLINIHAYELWTINETKIMKSPLSSALVTSCRWLAIALAGLVLGVGCGAPEKKAVTPKKVPDKTSPQARAMIKDLFSKDAKVAQQAASTLANASPESQEVIVLLVQMVGTQKAYSREAESILSQLGTAAVGPILADLQTIPETSDADAIILARHRGGWDQQGVSSSDPAFAKAMRAVHLIRVLREIGKDAVVPLQSALAQAQVQHRDLLANWLDWAIYGEGAPAVEGWPRRN